MATSKAQFNIKDPRTQEAYSKLKGLFPYIEDTKGLREYIGSQIDIGQSVDSIVRNIRESTGRTGEVTGGARKAAAAQFAPDREKLNRAELETKLHYEDLIKGLEKNQQKIQERRKELPEEILGEFSRRGLLRSGIAQQELSKGLVGLEESLQAQRKQVSTAQRERASRLAELAAQKLNLGLRTTQLATNLINEPVAAARKAEQEAYKQQLAEEKLRQELFKQEQDMAIRQAEAQARIDRANAPRATSGSRSSSGGSSAGRVTQASIDRATSILQNPLISDNPNERSSKKGDKYLSQSEMSRALDSIVQSVGGNLDLAEEIFRRAWAQGGFEEWTGSPEQLKRVGL